MKLEFLSTGSLDCPLIRLYDFTAVEAGQLRAIVAALSAATADRIVLHELPFVESVEGCRLTLCRRSWDGAVVRTGRLAEFECGFTAGTWDNVAGLIEPFLDGDGGFQWLAGPPGEAALLITSSSFGEW